MSVACSTGRGWLALLAVTLLALAGLASAAPASTAPASAVAADVPAPEALRVPVGEEPDGSAVELEADLYLPDTSGVGPAPAVLLAHGFGGSKAGLVQDARDLAGQGYVVLAYTARGFGGSGGRVHLNDPEFEIADATLLLDLLAERDEVLQDRPGDPRVAVVGGSYGGALALMAAGADTRVDSVVAMVTWHDLADAFYPQHGDTGEDPAPGPFKQLWASSLFGGIVTSTLAAEPSGDPVAGLGNPLCGRFDPELCEVFLTAAEDGSTDAELIEVLRAHSPAPTLDQVTAPTLLVQGMADSLFGLEHADATARALIEQGVPVAVRWFNGGHDGDAAEAERAVQRGQIARWLATTLGVGAGDSDGRADPPAGGVPAFTYALPHVRGQSTARTFTLENYPGLGDGAPGGTPAGAETRLALSPAGDDLMVSPPGGVPAAITVVPGLGGLDDLAGGAPTYPLAALPGQSVAFDTEPLKSSLQVVGAPRVALDITSTGDTSTFFLSLWQVQGESATLPRQLVAPVRVETTPGRPERVEVALPAATWDLPAGSTWRVLVTATDTAYRNETAARADRIALADPVLVLPGAEGTPLAGSSLWDTEAFAVAGVTLAVLLGIGVVALRRRARPVRRRAELADVPLVVHGLTKAYPDGHLAVDDVSWRADKGQVVGLLGPNGAGKTTTLRMVAGLIAPDSGEAHVLGEPVGPGAPVLARVGALIEGPGFLPHLTGRDNLRAYWSATGRPESEANYAEVLEVAALGEAVDRPVRAYSHGMKQRLGIAQAMLGLPEVLILDEPTNGLDPPQIAAMRPILHRYAAAGRTVIVSSHLLAEVELTCSHVVVMHAGRVVAAGSVEGVGVAHGRSLEEVFLATIAGLDGVPRDDDGGSAQELAARTERLRQVRPR